MKRPGKLLISQLVIILTFAGGIGMYFAMLRPMFIYQEYYRLSSEINIFFTYIQQNAKTCGANSHTLDSLVRRGEELNIYKGLFCVSDRADSIIYCSDKNIEGAKFVSTINKTFGDFPLRIINFEWTDYTNYGFLDYDKKSGYVYYAKHDIHYELMYFYAVKYEKTNAEIVEGVFLRRSPFKMMTLIAIVGGLLIICICFFNIRKQNAMETKEAVSRKELEAAAAVQMSMLPKGRKSLMQIDLDARLITAQKVGGDFYYYLLRDGKLFFCIGDVSGKGVSAALFMSRAVTLFRNSVFVSEGTAALLAYFMNRELCVNNDQNYFATAFIGIMNCSDGHLSYCNCGHNEPLYWNGKDGEGPVYLHTSVDIPLGFDAAHEFTEQEMEFDAGATFVFYTDGITEARSSNNDLYGNGRFLSLVDGIKTRSAASLNDAIIEKVAEFEKGTLQSDDITLVTFRNIPAPKVLEITNNTKELRRLGTFTDEIFKECILSDKERILIRSGLDEAMTNCVHYAYGSPGGKITLKAEIDNHSLVFTLSDSGREFNPLKYETPTPSEEDIRIGGLGIPIIKSAFDSLEYVRKDGMNILKMIKHL